MTAALDSEHTWLEATILGRCAEVGGTNFQTYSQMANDLPRRPNGRKPHRESIGRCVRDLVRAGKISSERVFTGGKMPGATWRSAHGTTVKQLIWRELGLKNLMTRSERRARRVEHAQQQRRLELGRLRAQVREQADLTSRCPTPRTATTLAGELDADLAAEIERARSAHERRQRAAAAERTGQVPVPSAAAEQRGPPE